MIFLLDNNVVAEVWKPRPDPKVMRWLEESDWWFIPAPVIAEIQEGVSRHPSQARRVELNLKLETLLADEGTIVVDWDGASARTWGQLKHSAAVRNQPRPL